MSPPKQTAPPDDLPVSVDDAKKNLRVVHSSDDNLIEALIEAAVSHLDGYSGILGRCMVTSTWEQKFGGWGTCNRLALPQVDPDSVEITYKDEDEADQTVPADQFEVIEDAHGSYIRFRRGFDIPALADDREEPITVSYAAGYGSPEDVPAAIRHAIKLIVGDLYENRENTVVGEVGVQQMPIAADRLITPYRRVPL